MPAPTLTAPRILVDPGYLYAAPLGTAIPVGGGTMAGSVFTDALSAPWVWLGGTADGHEMTPSVSVEYVRAAEFFDPVGSSITERTTTWTCSLMDITASKLKVVMNGGTITTAGSGATQINKFVPPSVSQIVRQALAWESTDATMRIFFFSVLATGDIAIPFRKAPDAATFPVTFTAEVPAGGTAAWETYTNSTRA